MKSPGQWLSWALSVAPSTGREMVRVALALRTFTATAELFARGELSYSKVRAITRCGEPALEELLLQYASNAPASQLEKIVQSYRSLEDDRDPHDTYEMALWLARLDDDSRPEEVGSPWPTLVRLPGCLHDTRPTAITCTSGGIEQEKGSRAPAVALTVATAFD